MLRVHGVGQGACTGEGYSPKAHGYWMGEKETEILYVQAAPTLC